MSGKRYRVWKGERCWEWRCKLCTDFEYAYGGGGVDWTLVMYAVQLHDDLSHACEVNA